MATYISPETYAAVAHNLRRLFPEIRETVRVLCAYDGSHWREFNGPEPMTAKQLTEHMLCFGYTAYQLELPTPNGCWRPDVHATELIRPIAAKG